MDDREVLRLLADILKKLEKVEKRISADRWPEVDELLAAIRKEGEILSDPASGIPARLAADPGFSSRYLELKDKIGERIALVTRTIGKWKEAQLTKIASSRNLADALARYARLPDTAFFVDKKE